MFLEISRNSQENTWCQGLFFIRLRAEACNFIKKESLAQVFSCEFCEISKNTFFYTKPPVAAPRHYSNKHVHWFKIDFYFHTILKLRPKSIQTKTKYLLFEKKCNAWMLFVCQSHILYLISCILIYSLAFSWTELPTIKHILSSTHNTWPGSKTLRHI